LFNLEKRGLKETPSDIISSLKGVVGFGVNTVVDFLSAPGQKASEWWDSSVSLLGYLLYSGIAGDLVQTFVRPGAITDIRIMGSAQARHKPTRHGKVATSEVNNFPHSDARW
jgi:predicted transcriptional regulator